MKTVLCYGDSLTWGFNAEGPSRHDFADRWPSRLASGLGADARVIAEGLNGRTTIYDDNSVTEDRNGARTLPVFLSSHQPLDLVAIMLGTNDLKRNTGGGYAFPAKQGMERLVRIVQTFPFWEDFARPNILIVTPPVFRAARDANFEEMFGHARAESRRLASMYRELGDALGCHVFDAAEACETTPIDGIHLDAENTRRLGDALVPVVRRILDATAD
ncbi:SGNH/GDSL hydrolase family protein [Consotaella aegiceratis]|uniref:SGNH/GDSL hydrolase family protein n=1 Tax=Consotaella aegiceratis TaxID=3097961 RepID=UPI002F3F1E93